MQQRFLVRGEARGGDTWIELVHDRFVEPIRASNAAWFPVHLSALQRQAALWDEQGRSSGLLLRDAALAEAEAWAANHPEELGPDEQEFLAACRQAQARGRARAPPKPAHPYPGGGGGPRGDAGHRGIRLGMA